MPAPKGTSSNHRGKVYLTHALQDALLEFLARFDAYGLEEGARHFSEHRFDQIQPGTVFDRLLAPAQIEDPDETKTVPSLDPSTPTAVFLVEANRGVGMHTLLWVQRMFPGHYKNFVFLCAGEVDAQSFYGKAALQSLRYRIENTLRYFTVYGHRHGLTATARGAATAPIPAPRSSGWRRWRWRSFRTACASRRSSCSSARPG